MLKMIADLLNFWSRANTRYNLLKYDDEKCDTSIRLGVSATVYHIAGLVIVLLCAGGFFALWSHFASIQVGDGTYDFPFFSILGLILLAGSALIAFLQCAAYGISLTVYQFKLNSRSVRWVALGTWFLLVLGSIASVVTVFFLL